MMTAMANPRKHLNLSSWKKIPGRNEFSVTLPER
jgi:hypothetical protein